MNETLNNLKTRRSIRSFLPKQVEKDLLEQVLEAGTFAPTGGGRQTPVIVAPRSVSGSNRLLPPSRPSGQVGRCQPLSWRRLLSISSGLMPL